MKVYPVQLGCTYAVTCGVDCSVVDENGLLLCNHAGNSAQSFFVATTQNVTVSVDDAVLTLLFNGAPVGNDNGGGTPLSSKQLAALRNAVGGTLANLDGKPASASGWIHTEKSSVGSGRSLRVSVNGVAFDEVADVDTLAALIQGNSACGVLAVGDGEYIRLTARVAGVAGNDITLVAPYVAKSQVSGATLTGGTDSESVELTVDSDGARVDGARVLTEDYTQPASPAVTELTDYTAATLEDGRVYHIGGAPDGGFNMTGLEVAPNATARIWVEAATGNVVFPEAWVWSDSSEFQLPAGAAGGVGDFVDGETYLITVCRFKYGNKDFVLAHRALTVKPAQA